MRNLKVLPILPVLSISLSCSPQLSESTKADDIRQLIRISGTDKAVEQQIVLVSQQIYEILDYSLQADLIAVLEEEVGAAEARRLAAEISDFLSQKILAQFQARTDDFLDLHVKIYDRHLTHSEVRELIQFYQSPTGQRLVFLLPTFIEEGHQAGTELGRKIGEEASEEAVRELMERYPELRGE